MTKLLTAIFLSLTIFSCDQTKKSTDADKERINAVCDKFMEIFGKGQYTEAMDLLKQNSVIEQEKIDTLRATIKEQMAKAIPAYGKMISSEFIIERKVKDFLTKRFYILKFDRNILKFDFTLYKSTNGWTITSFSYDDNLVELLY
jgi:hypothetical protein